MRKITRQITEAFANKQAKRSGNDEVTITNDSLRLPDSPFKEVSVVRLYLHRNKIAEHVIGTNILTVTLAGWGTNTTRERLCGLMTTLNLPIYFTQRNHEQYIRTATKGRKIDESELISIDLNTGDEVQKLSTD